MSEPASPASHLAVLDHDCVLCLDGGCACKEHGSRHNGWLGGWLWADYELPQEDREALEHDTIVCSESPCDHYLVLEAPDAPGNQRLLVPANMAVPYLNNEGISALEAGGYHWCDATNEWVRGYVSLDRQTPEHCSSMVEDTAEAKYNQVYEISDDLNLPYEQA